MKNISIKTKITIWFSVALILITSVTMALVLMISNSVIKKGVIENLARIVEDNVDEIEFYSDFESLDMDDDYDIYLEYMNGYLEIDDDFMRSVNGISSSIYDSSGAILYGENPIYKQTDSLEFENAVTRTVHTEAGNTYYIYDRQLEMNGADDLWLRGIVSSEYGAAQTNSIATLSLWILPLLVIFAISGGYIIAGRALAPVKKISESAENIREGHDLTKRIEIGEGNSELHSLANSFNNMLDRLEKSFKSEQQLTSDVSHELRTPVSVIMSQCEYTLEKERTSDEYIEAAELVLRQSRRMSSMINDMLTFARLEKRDECTGFEKINLSETVSSICEDMALIKERGIELHADIKNGVMINGDGQLMSRLTVNLISNAYRYGKDNGNIYVSLSENDDGVKLSVKDDGIGIADGELEKIWNRFYRADSSRSRKGTGLGLNFVKEIARIHGGSMSVESTEGEGSIFTLTVPKKK